MPITKSDTKKMQELASEGKQIKRIREDYFPHLSYAEVYLWRSGRRGKECSRGQAHDHEAHRGACLKREWH